MRFERITDASHDMYAKALALYSISFPPHEQREAISQVKILRDKEYCFNLVYDQNTFVGLMLCWETEAMIYVEHFCILPEMRNKRYGQKTLELLKCNGKKVILEIDPPVDDVSIHRRNFYMRCGFVENPYSHIHPPYHIGNAGHALVVMSFPTTLTINEYGSFNFYLEHHVMAEACS